MRPSRPLLPIRPLELPARLGRRQRSGGARVSAVRMANSRVDSNASVSATAACVRFEQSNLAVALAARPVWLRGPLFQFSRPQPSSAAARHAA